MKQTAKPNGHGAARQSAEQAAATANVMTKNYEQAFHTGLKLQEEALRWWGAMMNRAAVPEWRGPWTNVTALTGEVLSKAEEQIGEVAGLMEQNTRTAAELMAKAAEAAQSSGLEESQARWLNLWALSLKATEANVEALLRMGARTMDTCIDLALKGNDAQERTLKAA